MKQCKIIVEDEVNCKIKNLDLTTRKKLSNKFSFEIPGAKYMPAVKLGRWNGKECFFSVGGSTFINLLPEILPILVEEGYDIDLEDTRDYQRSFNFDAISETSFDNRKWPSGHPLEGQPILLRDYQVEAINTFLSDLQSLQELATGFGKTISTAAMSATVEKYGRSIIIVPNKSLVTQTEADYLNMGLDVGVFFGDRKEYCKTHTICTWQSLNVLMKNSEGVYGPDSFRILKNPDDVSIYDFIEGVVCVIVDECFDGNAKVLTPDGYIPIKDIKEGDVVINYSPTSEEFKEDVVVKKHINLTNAMSEKMYELEFDNGVKIQVTGNHKFFTTDGWIRADQLTEEHEIIHKYI